MVTLNLKPIKEKISKSQKRLGLLFKKFKTNSDCSLQIRINKDLESSRKKRSLSKIKFYLNQLYLPNKYSILVLFLGSLIIYAVAHLSIPKLFFINTPIVRITLDSNDYQNLIAITTGIGAIIFALIIFIAESLREDSERARILLKESLLYPLTFLGISTLLMFLWLDVTYFSVLVIVLLAIFSIYSVSRMIRVLLNRSLFLKKEQELFKDRIKTSIDQALRLRVGNNIYLKYLDDSSYNVDYSFLGKDRDDYLEVNITSLGVINDINFCELEKLLERLEELANINDLSLKITKTGTIPEKNSLQISDSFSETGKKELLPAQAYLLKKLGDEVNEVNKKALVVNRKLLKERSDEQEIVRLLNKVFIVSKPEEISLNQQLRDELSKKKDAATEALRSGRIRSLEEITELYVSVTDSFLEIIEEVGGGYSQKDAKQERGAFWGGWSEVKWVSKDLYRLIEESVQVGNKEALRSLSHIPVTIAVKAIQILDHFVFQEFIQFQSYIYRISKSTENSAIQKMLTDNAWRHLKEVADYYVGSELNKNRPAKELESLKDFGIDILQVFSSLLKEAFKQRDVGSFELFSNAVSDLFGRFKPSEDFPSVQTLKQLIKQDNISEKEKKETERKLEQQEKLEELEKEIKDRKEELFFGIAGWVFDRYQKENFTNGGLIQLWEICNRNLPTDFKALLDVYQRTHTFGAGDFWGWDWWELEGKEEGVAHSIDIRGKFDLLFAVKSLQIIERLNPEQIENIKIEPKRDLVYLFENDNSPVKNAIKLLTQDKEKWKNVISEESYDKIDNLNKLFASIVNEQELIEEDTLIKSSIDEEELENFYKEFKQAFHSHTKLRSIFQLKNKFIHLKRQVNKKILQWGFNQIDDKSALVKDWYIGHPGWGKHYGEELADAEDSWIFKEISNQLPSLDNITDSFDVRIMKAIKKLEESGYRASLIITNTYPSYFYRSEFEDGKFMPNYRIEDSEFKDLSKKNTIMGVFKYKTRSIPVVTVRSRGKDQKQEVCVLSLSKFAKLAQHPAYIKNGDKKYIKENDFFIFRIIDLGKDDTLRKSIIEKNPHWLETYENPNRYLKQKIVVNILERLELRIIDKNAGIKFSVGDDEE